ncbi:MAG: PsbP-related protein [Halobacteriota archaeon]
MNKKVFFGPLVIVMMLAVATAGCTSSTNSSSGGASPSASAAPQNISGYATYTNATAGVRIQYPPGWNVTAGGSNTTIVKFSTLNGVVNAQLFLNNESSSKISLDDFKNMTVSGLVNNTSSGLNYTLVSIEKTTLAGMPAYNLTLTATPSGVTIKQMVMMTEKDYQVYTLTYSTTPALFPDYQNDFSNMTNSFAITS